MVGHDADRMIVQLTAAELRALVSDAVVEALDAHAAPQAPSANDIVDAAAAAKRLHVSQRTLRHYVSLGMIEPVSVRAGGRRLYKIGDLDALLRRRGP